MACWRYGAREAIEMQFDNGEFSSVASRVPCRLSRTGPDGARPRPKWTRRAQRRTAHFTDSWRQWKTGSGLSVVANTRKRVLRPTVSDPGRQWKGVSLVVRLARALQQGLCPGGKLGLNMQ